MIIGTFTKPWMKETHSLDAVGGLLQKLGFNGVELCVREGYQVEPDNAAVGLKDAVGIMKKYGITVTSIASDTSETMFSACEEAGIPMIRTLAPLDLSLGYAGAVDQVKRGLDHIHPLCEKHHVKLGIQHHFGSMISHSMELYQLLKDYDPCCIGAIWDSAQSILAGEEPEQGLDIIWPYLCLVNLKNVYYHRTSGPESTAVWTRYFTTGKQGLADWTRVADYLRKKQYEGAVILTHEYTNQKAVNELLAQDQLYARELFEGRERE